MGFEFLALILILIGFIVSFKLKGEAARRARKWFAIGFALLLGGCFGSLAWLDAETSGSSNFATAINPFIYAGLFVLGVLVMFINSLQVFKARAEQKEKLASKDELPGEDSSRDF